MVVFGFKSLARTFSIFISMLNMISIIPVVSSITEQRQHHHQHQELGINANVVSRNRLRGNIPSDASLSEFESSTSAPATMVLPSNTTNKKVENEIESFWEHWFSPQNQDILSDEELLDRYLHATIGQEGRQFTSAASTMNINNKRGLTSSGKRGSSQQSHTPTNNIVAMFKEKYGIRQDAKLIKQYVSPDATRILIVDATGQNRVVPLNSLQPYNVFAYRDDGNSDNNLDQSWHNHIMNDGQAVNLEEVSKSLLFVGNVLNYDDDHDKDKVLLTKYPETGEIRAIHLIGFDGTYTYMQAILPGVLVSITQDVAEIPTHLDYSSSDSSDTKDTYSIGDIYNRELLLNVESAYDSHRDLQSVKPMVVVEVDIYFDSTYCEWMGGEQAAVDQIILDTGLASLIYQAQGVNTKIEITNITGFCDPGTDPFAGGIALGNIGCGPDRGVVQFFGDWLLSNRPNRFETSDSAHLFFAEEFEETATGCANYGSLCTSAYGAENQVFSRDDKRTSALFAHELGHNFGLGHVVSPDDYTSYVMDGIGFTSHFWSDISLEALAINIPTFDCLSVEEVSITSPPLTREPNPTKTPTDGPTIMPTKTPTKISTKMPTKTPTEAPIAITEAPTTRSTIAATITATKKVTEAPTAKTVAPSKITPLSNNTPIPTRKPTRRPTPRPTRQPTPRPTQRPTPRPTRPRLSQPPFYYERLPLHPRFKPRPDGTSGRFYRLRSIYDGALCLNVPRSDTSSNTVVRLWGCTYDTNQLWSMDNNGYIHSALDQNKCIGLNPSAGSNAISVRLYDCRTDLLSISQKWVYNTNTGQLSSRWRRSKCMQTDRRGGAIQVFECNDTQEKQALLFQMAPQ